MWPFKSKLLFESTEVKRLPLKTNVFDKWIPKKVRIASFEQAGAMLVIRWADWNGGIVSDPQWGKAAPLTGAFPIKIREDGKEVGGFLVNGDKGVAIKYDEDANLFKMTTSGELAWSILVTQKITDAYTSSLTGREKLIYFMAGFLPMAVMWWISGA